MKFTVSIVQEHTQMFLISSWEDAAIALQLWYCPPLPPPPPPAPRVPIQQYFYLGHTLLGLPTTRSCGSFMIFNVSYNNYLSKWFSLTKLLFPFYKVHENAYASYFHHCFSVQQNSSGTKHILWIVFLGYSSTSVATSSQIITGRSKLPCSQLITAITELFK